MKTMGWPFPRPRFLLPSLFNCKTSTYESHLLASRDKKHEKMQSRHGVGVLHRINWQQAEMRKAKSGNKVLS